MVMCRCLAEGKRSASVRSFIERRVVALRTALCCSSSRLKWTYRRIATDLNVSEFQVQKILTKWEAKGRQFVPDRRQSLPGPRVKVTDAQLVFITSPQTLKLMAPLTLRERCRYMRRHHNISICASTLLKYYARAGVVFRSV